MASLAVFLNDALATFHAKGEVKPRYYNPGGLFSEVHFFTPARRDIDPALVQDVVGDAKLVIHAMGPGYALSGLRAGSSLGALLRAIRPAVLRAYDPAARGALAVVWGRRLGIPAVVSVHADCDEQRQHERRFTHRARSVLERYTLRRADAVICVSRYVEAYARRYGARSPTVIYNRVYPEQFAPVQPRSERLGQNGRLTILSVGRLVRAKYQECLIRAVRGLDAGLLLIGDGELRGELQRLVSWLGMDAQVEFVRTVPHSRIAGWYEDADIFAIATHYEGFCVPVLEAMAAGLPVVASRIGPIEEILGDAGSLVENRPEAFREALEALVAGPGLRTEMGERALKRALTMDGHVMEGREKALYEALLRGTRS